MNPFRISLLYVLVNFFGPERAQRSYHFEISYQ